ncbi:MAG TPA: ACT domain-containing protein [Actinomycetota bacterium]|jgi:hypothetical protein|nr:ACT domain-containing protein [Actinomycetota bacterium]
MATDFEIVLEDHPGELARVGEALGGAGVNIEGIAGFGFEGRGIIHLLVEDAAAARSALESAGLSVNRESEAMVMELPAGAAGRPGEIGRMARAVADAGINFEAMYLATGNRAVAVTSDNEKTLAAMM